MRAFWNRRGTAWQRKAACSSSAVRQQTVRELSSPCLTRRKHDHVLPPCMQRVGRVNAHSMAGEGKGEVWASVQVAFLHCRTTVDVREFKAPVIKDDQTHIVVTEMCLEARAHACIVARDAGCCKLSAAFMISLGDWCSFVDQHHHHHRPPLPRPPPPHPDFTSAPIPSLHSWLRHS